MAKQPEKQTTAKRKGATKGAPKGAASGKEAPRKLAPEPESETEMLLEAANEASGSARNAWLAFLGLLAYLLVTLAGVTHVDLLLNSPVRLPIVGVEIPLFGFFLAAPFLLVLVHLSLLVQHALLAHKYQKFSTAIMANETAGARDHPARRLVHNYVVSQLLAGPRPPWLLRGLMRLMVFVTFTFLPVLVLVYFQFKFLPYHDVATTHLHRLAILADLVLLISVRPLIAAARRRPNSRKRGAGDEGRAWAFGYGSFAVAGLLGLLVIPFSLLVATVPQGCAWPLGTQEEDCFSLDRITEDRWPRPAVLQWIIEIAISGPKFWLFGLEHISAQGLGRPDGAWLQVPYLHRSLQLFEATLVREGPSIGVIASYLRAGKSEEDAFTDLARGLDLRGRDLRYANLGWARLYKADLRGAKLQGASLYQAKLQGAQLGNADLQKVFLFLANLQGADLRNVNLQGADLRNVNLQGGDLSFADVQGADLSGADLRGGDLTGANLQGAHLRLAGLQGADLRGADLQGATLWQADLLGADLSDANLQGVDLRSANLQGVVLMGAQLQGADLREDRIWQTEPPGATPKRDGAPKPLHLADLTGIEIAPLSEKARDELRKTIDEASDKALRVRLQERHRPLLSTEADEKWKTSSVRIVWDDLSNRPEPNRAELSDFLAELACKDDTGGHIANGLAWREMVDFNVDARRLAQGLTRKSCGPAAKLDDLTKTHLCELSAWPDEERGGTICAP